MRRSWSFPVQLFQVDVDGLAPSGVSQMAWKSGLLSLLLMGKLPAIEESIITRALTGRPVPLGVWMYDLPPPILKFGSTRKALSQPRGVVLMALTGSAISCAMTVAIHA